MFKFLRFEVCGPSTLLWVILFISPYLNVVEIVQIDATKLVSTIIGSIVVSIPIGNYIHQAADSICNPFRKYRLIFFKRAVICHLEERLDADREKLSDKTFQRILVFSKAVDRFQGDGDVDKTTFKSDVIREEISNRYSYYYTRIENGFFAPVIGGAIAALTINLGLLTQYFSPAPNFSPWFLVGAAFIAFLMLIWRIPQLFREIDDLEIALVELQKPFWKQLVSSTGTK